MIVKFLLILGISSAALWALRGTGSNNLAARRIGGVLFALAAALSVIFPDAVTWVAEQIGVGRGSDLVLYGLVLAFLFVSVGLYQRVHVLEDRITRLNRELSLLASQSVALASDAHGNTEDANL